jgi:hypothetical protein
MDTEIHVKDHKTYRLLQIENLWFSEVITEKIIEKIKNYSIKIYSQKSFGTNFSLVHRSIP